MNVQASGCSGCGLFWVLFFAFTLVPLVELALLLQVKEAVGLGPTLGLVFLTGVIGAGLARWQGLRVLARIQEEMRQGALPAQALFDGALILVAGCVLITPGICTDVIGFCLLIPPLRHLLGRGLRSWARRRFGVPPHPDGGDRVGPDGVIDAEVVSSRPVPPPQTPELSPPCDEPPHPV